ncbi:hypothetical protein SAMN05216524_105182 [Mucilaginibacter sp. OK098]|nr:hypothetical protein SAMN05216524_105182 [Mucilaginibacter sp. OK098]
MLLNYLKLNYKLPLGNLFNKSIPVKVHFVELISMYNFPVSWFVITFTPFDCGIENKKAPSGIMKRAHLFVFIGYIKQVLLPLLLNQPSILYLRK